MVQDPDYYSRKRASEEYDEYLNWKPAWQFYPKTEPVIVLPLWIQVFLMIASITLMVFVGIWFFPLFIVSIVIAWFSNH